MIFLLGITMKTRRMGVSIICLSYSYYNIILYSIVSSNQKLNLLVILCIFKNLFQLILLHFFEYNVKMLLPIFLIESLRFQIHKQDT